MRKRVSTTQNHKVALGTYEVMGDDVWNIEKGGTYEVRGGRVRGNVCY